MIRGWGAYYRGRDCTSACLELARKELFCQFCPKLRSSPLLASFLAQALQGLPPGSIGDFKRLRVHFWWDGTPRIAIFQCTLMGPLFCWKCAFESCLELCHAAKLHIATDLCKRTLIVHHDGITDCTIICRTSSIPLVNPTPSTFDSPDLGDCALQEDFHHL